MNRSDKIDYEILSILLDNPGITDLEVVDKVYNKFIFTNFFRFNKIMQTEIFRHFIQLIASGKIATSDLEKESAILYLYGTNKRHPDGI
jgi:hypothetical protein